MATKLGKLIRDPALAPALPRRATVAQTADRDARIGFLLVRAKIALALNPSWKGAAADDVSPVGVPLLKAALDTEVKAAATKIATLTKAMADPTVTDLLPIDDANIDPAKRFRRRYMSILGRSPQQLRERGDHLGRLDHLDPPAGHRRRRPALAGVPATDDRGADALVRGAARVPRLVVHRRQGVAGQLEPDVRIPPSTGSATVHRPVQGTHGVDHLPGDRADERMGEALRRAVPPRPPAQPDRQTPGGSEPKSSSSSNPATRSRPSATCSPRQSASISATS